MDPLDKALAERSERREADQARQAKLAQASTPDGPLDKALRQLCASFAGRMPETSALPIRREVWTERPAPKDWRGRSKGRPTKIVSTQDVGRAWLVPSPKRRVERGIEGGSDEMVSLAVDTDGHPWLVAWHAKRDGSAPRSLNAQFAHMGEGAVGRPKPSKELIALNNKLGRIDQACCSTLMESVHWRPSGEMIHGAWPSGQHFSTFVPADDPGPKLISAMAATMAEIIEGVSD